MDPIEHWNGLLRPDVELSETYWAALVERMREARLLFGGRLNCPFLRPIFVSPDDLASRFAFPPDSAKPRTYWFHMSGNITKSGITADLEAMREIGLGGTLFMNVSVALPTGLVETKDFMSPGWQECFQHMLNESGRLNLEFGSAVCDGWGNAGALGPAAPFYCGCVAPRSRGQYALRLFNTCTAVSARMRRSSHTDQFSM